MREVERYGIRMAGDWIDGGSSEEHKHKVTEQRDKEKERLRPALWSLERWGKKLESPQACAGGYSRRDTASCDPSDGWGS